MPIHDQGYRRYEGRRTPGRAWAVVAAAGIRGFLGKRSFLALMVFAWLPFFARAVQIYAAANVPQAAFLAPTPETFRQFLDQQAAYVFFISVYVGSGLIANDRRANALQLYLSKPLTRAEYVFGKLAILMTFLLMVTAAPAIALLIVQIGFAGNFTFLQNNLYLFPAIVVFSFLEATVVSAAILALSSLSNNSRYVGILYAALLFFSQAIYGVLFGVTRSTAWSWVSFPANLRQLGDAIFRLTPKFDTPWPVSLLIVLALIAASLFVLDRRVRAVEVVA